MRSEWQLWLTVAAAGIHLQRCHGKFNEEVVERVSEHLDCFLSRPKEILNFELSLRSIGAFPHKMGPADRDMYFAMAVALLGQPNTFYALEDGTFMGVASGGAYAFSKEHGSGNQLYPVPESPEDPNWKYWISCVNSETGEQENCSTSLISEDYDEYVECINDCELGLCPDSDSQRNCSALVDANDTKACWENVKYCPQYEVKQANFSAWAENNVTLGYIPRWYHCIDDEGRVTQEPGTCFFEDDKVAVERSIIADYEYCEGKGAPCNPLVGNYRVAYYDPRYRPFYTIIRESQKPLWAKPDPSFNSFEISYSVPMYSTDEQGRKIFDGVMAMDYDLRDITDYLTYAYNQTEIAVALFEQEEPHYVIATSTGTPPVFAALKDDPTTPCPYEEHTVDGKALCDPFRVPMSNFSGQPSDKILAQAFAVLHEAGFPTRELLAMNLNNDLNQPFYVTTIAVYKTPDEGLTWSFVVVMPGQSSADTLTPGEPGFALICGVATVGTVICLVFLVTFYRHRTKKAIKLADWRFTCLFFAGCACLNLVSFTFLGHNSKTTCLLRMWCFHMAFVATISPLLAKCLRMKLLLVGRKGTIARRRKITHFQTFLLMLPPIVLQALILLIFTFADPPTPTQVLEHPGTVDVTQHILCSSETNALFILQLFFEGSLTLAGALLAYHMRHLEAQYGETKQLLFAMSSILGVGAILVVFSSLVGYDHNGEKVLCAVGIFWGTAVCCCAFALPRLLTEPDSVRDSKSRRSAHFRSSTCADFRGMHFQCPEQSEEVHET